MNKYLTHWHIGTRPHPDTPIYPDKNAKHVYETACALRLDSSGENINYALDQFNPNRVDCKRCKVWLGWRAEATAPLPPITGGLARSSVNPTKEKK